jgi:23S rRNA U2552 (ribose-2'-O)-methylase RlmE/FtsJ
MGRDRMEHMFAYQDIDSEICEEVLEMANMAQHEMVSGVIKVLESEGKEVELNKINRYLQKYSQKVLDSYMHLF